MGSPKSIPAVGEARDVRQASSEAVERKFAATDLAAAELDLSRNL